MTQLTKVFFLISDSLLIPVLVALLIGLASVLLGVGRTFRKGIRRYRTRLIRREIEDFFSQNRNGEAPTLSHVERNGAFLSSVGRMIDVRTDHALVEKELTDAKRRFLRSLSPMKLWIKFGPALGLMGTLIPLGPALVGLANGDIESMAVNLQIAFATTVIGLLISLIAYLLSMIQKDWITKDLLLLTFIADRLEAGEEKGENEEVTKDLT